MDMLGAIRLSRARVGTVDPTTSPDRQHNKIEALANDRKDRIVGWARDIGVSGAVAPMDRPELGPWMRDRVDEYQGIIWASLDRAVRQMDDFSRIAMWAADNSKYLIFGNASQSVGEDEPDSLDIDLRGGKMRQAMGKLVLTLLSFAAEAELNSIRERNRDARHHMRQRGRWPGGMFPYHTMAYQTETGIWRLRLNAETRPHVEEIIARVLKGESKNSIVNDFNRRGILSPREYRLVTTNRAPRVKRASRVKAIEERHVHVEDLETGEVSQMLIFPKHVELDVAVGDVLKPGSRITKPILWNAQTLNNMLKARALIGQAELDGKMLLGPDGGPVDRVEPLITDRKQWDLLQQRLAEGSVGNGRPRTVGASALLQVAFCAICGNPLYRRKQPKPNNRSYLYYGCRSAWGYLKREAKDERCPALAIDGAELEEVASEAVIGERGDDEVQELVRLPAESHESEIEDAQTALERVIEMSMNQKSEAVRATYDKMRLQAEERLAELSALPNLPRRTELRGTGESYAEFWEQASVGERREMLIANDVKIFAVSDRVFARDALDAHIESLRLGGDFRLREFRGAEFTAWLSWPSATLS